MNEQTHVYFKELEKIINDYYYQALSYLKLPLISLNIGEHGTGGCKSKFFGEFNPDREYININLTEEKYIFYHYSKTKSMNNKEFHVFTLFHEVAHYFHYYWHNKHFETHADLYEHASVNMSDERYNKQNVEKHANNIAKVLYKRLYKNV